MSRSYGKMLSSLWTSSRKFQGIRSDDAARLLYFYLHTCPHGNNVGCFVIRPEYIAADLGWEQDKIDHAVEALVGAALIEWNTDEHVVRIVDAIDKDPPTNPSHAAAMAKTVLSLPDTVEKLNCLRELSAQRQAKTLNSLREEIALLSSHLGHPLDSLSTACAQGVRPYLTLPNLNLTNPTQTEGGVGETTPRRAPAVPAAAKTLDTDFDTWWRSVPLKRSKGKAREAYKRVRKKAEATTLLAGIERYAQEVAGREPRFIKHPTTWLNAECWLDEDSPATKRETPVNGLKVSPDVWAERVRGWWNGGDTKPDRWIKLQWGNMPNERFAQVPADVVLAVTGKKPEELLETFL